MTKITQELVKNLFYYRDGNLYWKISPHPRIKIGDKAGTLNKITSRYQIGINGKVYLNHRLIFLYHHGYLPKIIDHINRNKSDNHIENLRESTQSQNLMNSKSNKNSSSKFKGICWDKPLNKWKAYIKINKKLKHLGYFIDEINAAKAYNEAAIKYYGEYAYLNKIKGEIN